MKTLTLALAIFTSTATWAMPALTSDLIKNLLSNQVFLSIVDDESTTGFHNLQIERHQLSSFEYRSCGFSNSRSAAGIKVTFDKGDRSMSYLFGTPESASDLRYCNRPV
ncbi:MAG: hypothetical protein V4534_04985 [Myxococcota bacterium]